MQLTCCPGNSGDWPDHGLTRLEGPEVDGGGRGPWLVTPAGHHGDRHRHHLVTSGSGGHRHRLPGLNSDLESGGISAYVASIADKSKVLTSRRRKSYSGHMLTALGGRQ